MKRGGSVFIAGGFLRSIAKSVNILGGFEFSQLDAARSGSALTAVKGCHSLPSPLESVCQKEKGDSNSRSSTLLGQARL